MFHKKEKKTLGRLYSKPLIYSGKKKKEWIKE